MKSRQDRALAALFALLLAAGALRCIPPAQQHLAVESPVSPQQNLQAQGMEPYRSAQTQRGYVRVGPTRHYFQFEDGTPFIPIGHSEWPSRFETAKYSPESIDSYFRILSQNGVTVLRLVLDDPNLPIEKPPGTFNPAFKAYLDLVVRSAEKHQVYLQLAMWPNVFNVPAFVGFGLSWSENLYNKRNGGPVARFEDLFRAPEALKLQEGRIRFFIDNWGNSPNIFAWEIANEFDYDNDMWVDRMASYCREYEKSKWGKSRLVTISVAKFSFGTARNAQWSSPHLDFSTFHTYDYQRVRAIKGRGADRLVNYTFAAPEFFREAREKCKAKPLFDSEIPGISHGSRNAMMRLPTDLDLMEEWFLGMGWAYLCSGAASPGLRWASSPLFNIGGAPNALSVRMYQYQLATRRITDRVDWNRFADPAPYTGLTARAGPAGADLRVVAVISGDRKRVVAWVFERYGAQEPVRAEVSFSGLDGGAHLVGWYDDRTGRPLAEEKRSGSSFSVASPAFLGHTVVLVKPAGD